MKQVILFVFLLFLMQSAKPQDGKISMNLTTSSLLVFILICTQSFAQRDLSASEAVFIALENNYQVVISQKQQEINQMNNKWSEAGAFPTVELTVLNGNSIQDNTNNEAPFTIPGIILTQSLNPTLSANWNIFTGIWQWVNLGFFYANITSNTA